MRQELHSMLAAVSSSGSLLAQLLHLSQRRDPHSGLYSHAANFGPSGKEEVHRALLQMHHRVFAGWLALSPSQQKADLTLCLSTFDSPPGAVARAWLSIETYRVLVPATASRVDRALFFDVLRHILQEIAGPSTRLQVSTHPAHPSNGLITVRAAARLLNVSPRTLRYWAEIGHIPAVKLGRAWRFHRIDIERSLMNSRDPR